jgi:hypothetical protein
MAQASKPVCLLHLLPIACAFLEYRTPDRFNQLPCFVNDCFVFQQLLADKKSKD